MNKYSHYLNNKAVQLALRALFIGVGYLVATHAAEFYHYLKQ